MVKLGLRDDATQFHCEPVRPYEVGVFLVCGRSHTGSLTYWLPGPTRGGNEVIEPGAKPGDETPPLRFVDEGPGRRTTQPGDGLIASTSRRLNVVLPRSLSSTHSAEERGPIIRHAFRNRA